jgi:PTH1 family peptidyl-tRNA hydrolase
MNRFWEKFKGIKKQSKEEVRDANSINKVFAIIGLGNPGAKYRQTRHNAGFYVIDSLASRNGINLTKLKHKCLYGEGTFEGTDKKVLLIKPQTFMNASGECVRELVNWYKLDMSQILVIYDDIDIPTGTIRIRKSGSAGSHNGMKSIIYQINSDEFARIRIGIGSPPKEMDLAAYVLSNFNDDEIELMNDAVLNAAKASETIVTLGTDKAMNMYNVPPKKEENGNSA